MSIGRSSGYFQSSRTLAFGLIAVLPLLVGYEYLTLRASQEHMLQVRNGADVILRMLFNMVGVHSPFYLGIGLLVAIGLAIKLRKRGTRLQMPHFFIAIIESVIYAVALTFILTRLTNGLMLSMAPARAFHAELMLALGAGVYEELVFRFLLFSNMALIFRYMTSYHPAVITFFCAIFSSVLFSAAHYMGVESFTFYSAVFRFFAGMLFCLIYYYRGLGIAAWTHAIYDIFLIM